MTLLDRRRSLPQSPRGPLVRKGWARPLVASALTLAALLHVAPAHADARREARKHFQAGMELCARKKYQDGIKELEKAYEILPHPNVAFNIAQAQAEGGSLELAIRAYKTYLASDPVDRVEVQKVVEQLEAKVAAQQAPEAAPAPVAAVPASPKPDGKTIEPLPGDATKAPAPSGPSATPPAVGEARSASSKEKDRKDTEAIVGSARTEDIYEETVITASRGAQSPLDSPSSTTIITKQDIRLSGNTRIPELLRRVAGMDVMQITGGDENVSMRGFNSRLANKLLVLVNGRAVNNDILGSTFWESLTIDVDQIERIEVVRGPGSALYGADAFAGVINIITIAPGEGKPGFRVGFGDTQQAYGSVWASGRDGDFSYRASAGYTRYPRWSREVGQQRLDLTVADTDQNVGAQNGRIDLRTTERLGSNASISLGGGFSRSELDVYGIGPINDYFARLDNSDITADFKSKYVNARVYYTRLGQYGQSSEQDSNYVGHTLMPSFPQENIVDAEAEFAQRFSTGPAGHDVHIGLGYRLKDITWEYINPKVEHHVSAYLQDTLSLGKVFALVGSGRIDYVPYLNRPVGSPRAAIILKPTDRQAIRLSGSTAFRAPTFLESYLDLGVQVRFPGIESAAHPAPGFILQPEQITSAEVSYLNQQNDSFEFELTAYYNRVTDLISLADVQKVSLSDLGSGAFGGFDAATGRYQEAQGAFQNQCDTYNVFGGEAGARVYPVDGLDLFANYALNLSNQSLPDGCTVPQDNRTSQHKLNVGVQVRTKPGLNGEVTFNYQTAQTWNEQIATLSGVLRESFPLPAYGLLNGRLGFRFYKERAEISGVVFNALAGALGSPPPQMHPFGNQVGRRVMGFLSYSL